MDKTLTDKTLSGEPSAQEAAELQAAIAQCFAEMDQLRGQMHLKDAAIEAARKETLANLEEIAHVLAELKAA